MSATPHDAHSTLAISGKRSLATGFHTHLVTLDHSAITINSIRHLRRLQSATLIVNEHEKEVQWTYPGNLRAEATFEPALSVFAV